MRSKRKAPRLLTNELPPYIVKEGDDYFRVQEDGSLVKIEMKKISLKDLNLDLKDIKELIRGKLN